MYLHRFTFIFIYCLTSVIPFTSGIFEEEIVFQNLNAHDYNLGTPGRIYGFCKTAAPKSLFQMWSRSYIKFENRDLVDVMYTGSNEQEVRDGLRTWLPTQYMLTYNLFRSNEFNVPLFGNFCVALRPSEATIFHFRYESFAWKHVFLFALGLIIFFTANFVSRQMQTFYVFGATFGTIGGFVVLCFILKRFLPKQNGFLWYIFSGLFNFYILNKGKSLIFTYPYNLYLAIYLILAAFIGFGVAYYYGKSFDARIYDIIRWVIRAIGLSLIGISTECLEYNLLIVSCILVYHHFPTQKFLYIYRTVKLKIFKPKPIKIELLSEKEYEKQTKLATKKALDDLRRFCNSPECQKWATMRKLNDPKRFAAFVSGDDHVSVDEITAHTFDLSQLTDDEN